MTVTRADGAPVDRRSDPEVRRARPPWTRPLAAAGLSLLWPGLGHAFLGRTAAAVACVTAQVVLVVLSVAPGFWRVTVPIWLVLVASAAATAAWAARREGHASVE